MMILHSAPPTGAVTPLASVKLKVKLDSSLYAAVQLFLFYLQK